MEKSLTLEEPLTSKTELEFFDLFGNILNSIDVGVSLYEKSQTYPLLRKIEKLKADFYMELTDFIRSDYVPKGKITNEHISKFYRYEKLNWTNRNIFNNVKLCLYFLKEPF